VAVRYKQPSRINAVSITLFVLLMALIWVGYGAWPVIALNANVKNELEGALPRAYKANLLPEPTATEVTTRTHDELLAKLKDLGVEDVTVTIDRDQKTVSIEARYKNSIVLKGLDKKYEVNLSPRVKTDAGRVDW
jgi:hypothetical protein